MSLPWEDSSWFLTTRRAWLVGDDDEAIKSVKEEWRLVNSTIYTGHQIVYSEKNAPVVIPKSYL